MLIVVFPHVVFGFFQSLRSSVMGGFDPVRIYALEAGFLDSSEVVQMVFG
jgi:hypothetical protein